MNTIEIAYSRFCKTRFPLPSESEVATLEYRIGVMFPEDYRRFILEFNGGLFNEPDFDVPSEEYPSDCLKFLHGIHATHPFAELATKSNLATFDDNDPPQIVPIGYTLMGGMILLVTHEEDRGRIGLKKAFGNTFFLADGIEDFLALLHRE